MSGTPRRHRWEGGDEWVAGISGLRGGPGRRAAQWSFWQDQIHCPESFVLHDWERQALSPLCLRLHSFSSFWGESSMVPARRWMTMFSQRSEMCSTWTFPFFDELIKSIYEKRNDFLAESGVTSPSAFRKCALGSSAISIATGPLARQAAPEQSIAQAPDTGSWWQSPLEMRCEARCLLSRPGDLCNKLVQVLEAFELEHSKSRRLLWF